MKVEVLYFASIREAVGEGETIELADGTELSGLRDLLIARGGAYSAVLARGRSLRCAVDQEVAHESAVLHDGAEVAFFPPVTGG